MLVSRIEQDIKDVMDDPELQIQPEGLSQSERDRWLNWQLSGGHKHAPSPGQIDAAASLIRAAGLQAELEPVPRHYHAMDPMPAGSRLRRW